MPVSKEEIRAIIYVQQLLKLKISRQNTMRQTAIDLGNKKAINIDERSEQNLKNIKIRLNNRSELSVWEKQQEDKLLKVLLTKEYFLKHTIPEDLLEGILSGKDKCLLDPKEAERRNIPVKTATPNFGGIKNNIFFGFGAKNNSIPLFTQVKRDPETGKVKNYSTVIINFSEVMRKKKELLDGVWSSGHFYKYAIAHQRLKFPSEIIGDTSFFWEYGINNVFKSSEKCLVKYLNCLRADGTLLRKEFELGDEISTGKDFIPFFAYLFIERLYYLGGKIRKHLLSHPNDMMTIDLFIEKLFRVDNFEVHLPTKFPLNIEQVEIMTKTKQNAMTMQVNTAAKNGNIKKLQTLKNNNYPLDGYMYYVLNSDEPFIELPIITAIISGQLNTVKWLIDNGANKTVFVNFYNRTVKQESDFFLIGITRSMFIAACNLGNLKMLHFLLQQGLKLNCYYQSRLQQRLIAEYNGSFTRIFNKTPDKLNMLFSDQIFLALLESVTQNGDLTLLDYFVEKFTYFNSGAFTQQRFQVDMAAVGSQKIINYFTKKWPEKFSKFENYGDYFFIAVDYENKKFLHTIIKNISFYPVITSSDDSDSSSDDEVELAGRFLVEYALEKGKISLTEWIIEKFTLPITSVKLIQSDLESIIEENYHSEVIKWLASKEKFIFSAQIFGSIVSNGDYTTAKWLFDFESTKFANNLINNGENLIGMLFLRAPADHTMIDFADYLLQRGFTVPTTDSNVLCEMIRNKCSEAVQWLIDNGCSLSTSEARGAIVRTNKTIAEILVKNNFLPINNYSSQDWSLLINDVCRVTNAEILKWIPLEHLKTYISNNNLVYFSKQGFYNVEVVPLVEWLVQNGANLSAPDRWGNTFVAAILMRNIVPADSQLLALLTKYKVNVSNEIESYGTEALATAITKNNFHVIAWLIENKVNVNKPIPLRSGDTKIYSTQLLTACNAGKEIIIKGLLEVGADPNLCGSDNISPLYFTIFKKQCSVDIVNLLLQHGANSHEQITFGNKTNTLCNWVKQKHPKYIDLFDKYNLKQKEKINLPRDDVHTLKKTSKNNEGISNPNKWPRLFFTGSPEKEQLESSAWQNSSTDILPPPPLFMSRDTQ